MHHMCHDAYKTYLSTNLIYITFIIANDTNNQQRFGSRGSQPNSLKILKLEPNRTKPNQTKPMRRRRLWGCWWGYIYIWFIHRLNASNIQKGPIHRNRNFLGIAPSRVWKTSTGFLRVSAFSVPLRCRSTKALCCHCRCSSWAILTNRCSPSSRSCSSRYCSDWDSGSVSLTWTWRLGTWNSIDMTSSKPNAFWNGVDSMLVLNVVR